MAVSTRRTVFSRTPSRRLTTRSAVASETPASRATSSKVVRRTGRWSVMASASSPEHAADHELLDLRHVKLVGPVPERGIEHAPLAEALLPHHRHDHALDPGRVLPGERGRGQHLVRGVDMHVVLLGAVLEAL